ncbi:DUF7344 domain-containing protein [Natronorubrum sp. DTA7]|uniref:DUF7344 domain-containing protein n=1 Tax=Natronorubrum sp. DTA7 TaxID=3447016 RepID=UPI003F878618
MVEQLGSTATMLDETVALYGIDYAKDQGAFADRLESLTQESGFTYTIIAVNQSIWPPAGKDESVIGALEAADTAAPFVSEIAAGGLTSAATWEADRYNYSVTYAGTSNPAALDDDTDPTASLITVEDHETATRTPVPIFTTEPKSSLETRRREFRDELEDILCLLQSERRRIVLELLSDLQFEQENETVTVRVPDLSRQVAATETDVDSAIAGRTVQRSSRFALHHTHLPMLDEYGVVEFDEDANEVSTTGRTEAVTQVMHNIIDVVGKSNG